MPMITSIRLVVSLRHRLVTDGQADGQIQNDSIYRASIAPCGKKTQARSHDTTAVTVHYERTCFGQ